MKIVCNKLFFQHQQQNHVNAYARVKIYVQNICRNSGHDGQ